MICITKRIPYRLGETIRIRPIFDIHYGSNECDVKELKKFLADDPESCFVGGGDWFDSIVVTDPRYTKSNDAMEKDAIIDEQVYGLEDIMRPYKDRILGIGSGNHEATINKKGTHPTRRISRTFDITHLGLSWMIRLLLHENNARVRTVLMYGHHGFGGGSRTEGADITKYTRHMAGWEADIFLYDHIHRKQSVRVNRMKLVNNKMITKPKLLGICGTFKKTFTLTDEATYEEIRGYLPTEIGGIIVNIKPTNKWCDYWIDV